MKAILLAVSCVYLPLFAADESTSNTQPAKAKESAEKVTAKLFGKEITAAAGDDLNGTIFRALSERHVREKDIHATNGEIDAFHEAMDRKRKASVDEWKQEKEALEKELQSTTLTDAERKVKSDALELKKRLIDAERENDEQRRKDPVTDKESRAQFANQLILAWKFSQSLFQKYGGRVIFQQSGPEPLDAYRDFLKEHEKNGDFKILDEGAEKKFWEYFINDGAHTFYPEEEGRKMMTTPWWLGK